MNDEDTKILTSIFYAFKVQKVSNKKAKMAQKLQGEDSEFRKLLESKTY